MITRRQSLRVLVGLALAGKGVPAAFSYTVSRRKKDVLVLDEINVITLKALRGDRLADNFFGPESVWMNPNWPNSPWCKMLISGGDLIRDPIGWQGND